MYNAIYQVPTDLTFMACLERSDLNVKFVLTYINI